MHLANAENVVEILPSPALHHAKVVRLYINLITLFQTLLFKLNKIRRAGNILTPHNHVVYVDIL